MKIKNLKKKMLFTILTIIILTAIGFGVFFVKKYFNTEKGKNRIYAKELSSIDLTKENKEIIAIIKDKINEDEIEDYIVLQGEPKYEETDVSKVKILQSFSSELEMYNNISIIYVNGKETDKEKDIYNTNKTYGRDVNLEIVKDKNNKAYIKVSDTLGNISLFHLKEEKLKNIITNTVGEKEFVGYTIEGKFRDEDGVKLDVSLDNYSKDYLKKDSDKHTLDFKDTNVNEENYRLTYMADKFSKFDFEINEDSSIIYLNCAQNVLYANNKDVEPNVGFVITKFKIINGNKLEFSSVEVVK